MLDKISVSNKTSYHLSVNVVFILWYRKDRINFFASNTRQMVILQAKAFTVVMLKS